MTMKATTLKKLAAKRRLENNQDKLTHRRTKHPVIQYPKLGSRPGISQLAISPVLSNTHHQYSVDSISRIRRKPSDIDPSGKDPESTDKETGSATAKETGPNEEDRLTGSQSVTDNVGTKNEPPTGNQSAEAETSAHQEPLTRDQPGVEQNKDIPETEGQASSPPLNDTNTGLESSSFDKVQGPARPPPKIITGNQSSESIYI